MPRWICPTCHAVMTVKSNLLGLKKPCAKCGKPSEVFDVDAVEDEAEDEFDDDEFEIPEDEPPRLPSKGQQSHRPGSAVPAAVVKNITTEVPTLIMLYRYASLGGAGLVVLICLFVAFRAESLVPLIPAVFAIGFLALIWIATDFMSDLFRCRRLLEEMAQR